MKKLLLALLMGATAFGTQAHALAYESVLVGKWSCEFTTQSSDYYEKGRSIHTFYPDGVLKQDMVGLLTDFTVNEKGAYLLSTRQYWSVRGDRLTETLISIDRLEMSQQLGDPKEWVQNIQAHPETISQIKELSLDAFILAEKYEGMDDIIVRCTRLSRSTD